MGDVFAQWRAAAVVWGDALHQGLLGVIKALGGLVVAWHATRAGRGP